MCGIMTSLNLELFEELRILLNDNFSYLIDTYISDTTKRVEQLNAAIETENWDEVRTIAHVMKSSSANIGALELSDISQQIEHDSVYNTKGIKIIYARLRAEFNAVILCLNKNR